MVRPHKQILRLLDVLVMADETLLWRHISLGHLNTGGGELPAEPPVSLTSRPLSNFLAVSLEAAEEEAALAAAVASAKRLIVDVCISLEATLPLFREVEAAEAAAASAALFTKMGLRGSFTRSLGPVSDFSCS